MKRRSPIAVILLTIITLGIYGIVWFVKTKLEMNREGAKIPTAWLIIIPFVSIWWLWKYSEGVEDVSKGETSTGTAFLLLFVLGLFGLTIIGMAVIQSQFNKLVGAAPAPAAPAPAAPAQAEAPTNETPTPPTPPTPPVVQ